MSVEPLDIRSTLGLGSAEVKAEVNPTPIQSKPRYVKLEQDQKDLQTMRENLKKQCENIKKSEHLRCKIYKAVNNGENHTDILLMAIECISLMTGDRVFLEQNKNLIKKRDL